MKTNRNIFNKLFKATLIIALAFTSQVSVSCQTAAHQSFNYKTNFIKQMVYQFTNDFFTRTGIDSDLSQNNLKEAASFLVNYTISDKNSNCCSTSDENELADFLTKAAKLNASVAEIEVEKDNTLDFLTAAAHINASVDQDNNSNDNTLDFLINAAQLNVPLASEENNQDNDLLDFLTQAAHLNACVAE